MSERSVIINHLESDYTEPIRDPLWRHIYLSPGLLKVIEQPSFLTLGKIKQLGAAHLVYPGATHTRLNHSLGVFHLAKRIIRTLAGFSSCSWLTLEGVKAFLAAALLHDLGHFPFTHSFKELPLKEHETLTAELMLQSPMREAIENSAGTDAYFAAAIVDQDLDTGGNEEIDFFRNILSGVLDPDKLDYLNRDAYFCGVSYGVQDIDFIINRIMPHSERGIALDIGGLPAVENILFSKYLMYRTVYWHKTVRIATAMIKKAVYLGLNEELIPPEALYGLNDESFFSHFSNFSFPAFDLINRVARRNLFKVFSETPFDENDPRQTELIDLKRRTAAEAGIARQLTAASGRHVSPFEVILDIPESISFEINLPVHSEDDVLSYPEAGTVFTRPVVDGFRTVLRKVRLIVPEDLLAVRGHPEDILPWK